MSAITTRDIANLKPRNYDAGGLLGFGEGLARCGFAEAEDEAVHLGERSSATSRNRRRRAAVAMIKIETARAALRFA